MTPRDVNTGKECERLRRRRRGSVAAARRKQADSKLTSHMVPTAFAFVGVGWGEGGGVIWGKGGEMSITVHNILMYAMYIIYDGTDREKTNHTD